MKYADVGAGVFPSNDTLQRMYTLGGGSSIDLLPVS